MTVKRTTAFYGEGSIESVCVLSVHKFSSAIALFTAILQSVFATIIGFGNGDSPFLCQFYHSSTNLFY